jgi:hypothetical protein
MSRRRRLCYPPLDIDVRLGLESATNPSDAAHTSQPAIILIIAQSILMSSTVETLSPTACWSQQALYHNRQKQLPLEEGNIVLRGQRRRG